VKSDADLDLLEMWLDAGHELGNHSHGHLDYPRTDSTAYIDDVEKGRAELAEFLRARGRSQPVRFFRFPFLREGETLAKLDAMRRYLAASGQRNLHVTIDDQDWSFERPWVEARRAKDAVAMARVAEEYQASLRLEVRAHEEESERLFERVPPQVMLLHANEVGAAQWDSLFAWLAANGHRFAGADEVLADSAFAEPCDFVSRYGGSLWFRIADCRRRDAARGAVESLLAEQATAWNRGDLEAFCSAYAEDATFVSPSGTSRGRAMILERYRMKYADRAAMGTLTLEVVEGRAAGGPEISMLGDAMPGRIHAYSVAARWTLAFPEDGGAGARAASDTARTTRTGMTLLVLHRGADGWKIVQDASM
jgi:ketosteroid isomerase-like protein